MKAQDYFKFPITKDGFYKITLDQAKSLGLNDLNDIRIFGNEGMLPQKLDSAAFSLNEIPVKKTEQALYFFLSGPHTINPKNQEEPFHQNSYTDTLYYILASRSGTALPVEVTPVKETSTFPNEKSGYLYQLSHYFLEENNLLSSGREWYGLRVFDQREEIIPLQFPSDFNQESLWISATFMAQSTSESQFHIEIQNNEVADININAIPDTRYGIKGREGRIQDFFPIKSLDVPLDWRFSFHTQDQNGMGFLKHALVGFPYDATALPEGVYHNLNMGPVSIRSPHAMIWEVSDLQKPLDLSSLQPIPPDNVITKLAIADPQNIPPITSLAPIDMSIRQSNEFPEFLIITTSELYGQATRLADFKNSRGTVTRTVLLEDIFDAFGYGNPDITAIRNFLAFQFHRGKRLKNVLLFGKGTFDYKGKLGGRPNLIPTYSSISSLNPLTTYGSDDYYGFLQIGEGEWQESEAGDHLLDIGIGRIPAISRLEASVAVDKIITYQNRGKTSGNWKTKMLFIADDGDNNIHLRDAENHTRYLHQHHPEFELHKLYLDTFEHNSTGSNQIVPEAKTLLADYMEEGVLLVNFIGHGNEVTLTAEEIFTVSDLRDWPESDRLPVFVTATCEFGRQDSPFIRSGAEELLFAERKGAIALLTTGRPVFSSINFALNKAFIEAFLPEDDEISLGEIYKITKNNSLNGPLNRNFSLLGDPSLKLNLPELTAATEAVIDLELEVEKDSLAPFREFLYQGSVRDPLTDALINQFNGPIELVLNGQPRVMETLGNESPIAQYITYNNVLFRGKGEVVDGRFEGTFFYGDHGTEATGIGAIRVFAQDENHSREALGVKEIPVSLTANETPQDEKGPVIQLVFQDSLKSAKKITSNQTPAWIYLKDDSGINISGTEPGKGISLSVNGQAFISLNETYYALKKGFKEGYARGLISGLQEGKNTITVRSYDNLGNMSEKTESLEVSGSLEFQITTLFNYPNPAHTQTQFKISHNRPGENINLKLRVFSLLGNEIFSFARRFPKADATIEGINWIFLDRKTNYPVKGTYLYKIELIAEEEGTSVSKGGKLIIQ